MYYLDKYATCECKFLSKRYLLLILLFVGLSIAFAVQHNIFNAKLVIDFEQSEMNMTYEAAEHVEIVMSHAFFWSYLVMQIPGGILAAMYPPTQILGYTLLMSFCLSWFIPTTLRSDTTLLIFVRIFQGSFDGMAIPAVIGVLRHWTPVEERARMICFTFCGPYFGLFVAIFLTSIIDHYTYFADSVEFVEDYWYVIYYSFSTLGILWWFAWTWLVYETPRQHPTISYEELHYIEKTTDGSKRRAVIYDEIPWKSILTSKCVYAIIVANFCRCFNYFLTNAFGTDATHPTVFTGNVAVFLLGIPFLILLVIVSLSAVIADILVNKQKLTIVNCRKTFTGIGFASELLPYLIYVIFDEINESYAIFWSLGGVAIAGFSVNYLDIAPRYASLLMGFSNAIGLLAGTSSLLLFAHVVKPDNYGPPSKLLLSILVVVLFSGIIIFCLFASDEEQPWAKVPEREHKIKSTFEIKFNAERQKHMCTKLFFWCSCSIIAIFTITNCI